VFHTGVAAPGGFVGVDVFFVVSGFVITGLLLRELAGTGRLSLPRFYLRRVRRLLPALAVTSVATLAASALLLSPLGGGQQALGRAVTAAAAFAANGYFFTSTGGYFQQTATSNPFLHTWTLSVEEQFYLVFPALVAVGWWLGHRVGRRRERRRGRHLDPHPRPGRWVLPGLLLAALLVSLVAALAFSYGRLPAGLGRLANPDLALQFAFYSPLTRGWEFLTGALVALVPAGWAPRRRLAAPLGLAGAGLLAVATFGLHATDRFPGALAALPVGGAVALLLAGRAPAATVVTRVLAARPAVRLGDLSYSWYLWHWPVIVLARTWWPGHPWVPVVAAAGSLVPAVVCYRLVERPIHQGRRLVSRRATAALAAACLAVPLLGGAGLAAAAGRSWGRADIAGLRALTDPEHLDLTAGCIGAVPSAAAGCTWTVPASRGTVLLIGDSNAGHLTEPVLAAARGLGYDVQVATDGGCPFLLRDRYFTEACRRFVQGGLAAIAGRARPYAAVVVSNASVGYLGGPLVPQLAADAPAGATGTQRDLAIAGWAADVRRTVAAVAAHSPVLVVGAVPQFAGLPQCLRPGLLAGPAPGCGRLDPAAAWRARGEVVAAERPVVTGLGAGYLDTGDQLCTPAGGCTAFVAGTLVYRDGAHLSVSGSMIFEAPATAALRQLIGGARPTG
jgi:peptidoglycan/LPS O-acetylase OafA/YrhL